MRTTATRTTGGWLLNGSRAFIMRARRPRHGGDGCHDGAAGTTGILPYRRAWDSRHAGREGRQAGMRASDTTEVLFENCEVPAGQLLGEEG